MARMRELVDAMEAGRRVVTATQRAARRIRRDFDEVMGARGLRVWEPAEVLAWESWTGEMWRRLVMDGRVEATVLNRSQEMALWREVIAGDLPASTGEMRAEFAVMAMEAWSLLYAYGAAERLARYDGNADMRAFRRWAEGFRGRLRAGRMISRAQVEGELAGRMGQVWAGGEGLEMVGFGEWTPAQASLLEAVRAGGVEVRVRAARRVEGVAELVRAESAMEEIAACAAWVQEQRERAPGARIGVVVPGLGAMRGRIDRVFRRVVSPGLESLEGNEERGAPWEFSLGVALAETTAGAAALTLLRWVSGPLEVGRVSALVLTPFLGGAAVEGERWARAAFDARELRQGERLRPEWAMGEVLQAARGSRQAGAMPALVGAVRGMAEAAERVSGLGTRSYGDWAQEMRRVLEAARWAEGVGSGSLGFQLRERWEAALDALTTLDLVSGAVGYGEAVGEMERMARETVFAAEAREAPIQVVGPREVDGEVFDAIWFLGAGEETWPVREGAQALLPRGLQREAGMPGMDVAAEAERGRAVTERIRQAAERVVFSYAGRTETGVQRASAALGGMALRERAVDGVAEEERVALETREDVDALPALPDGVIPGGTAVLQWQAACGFRAFALGRLGGRRMEQRELGWDARQRGTLMHRVLELFWEEVRTQAALRAMSEDERLAMIGRSFDAAAAKTQAATAWDAAYLRVQRERMQRVLCGWMEMEAGRRLAFTVSTSEEVMRDVAIGPLRLNVKMDRVDVTERGEILIDYKTGSVNPSAWTGERPDQPQLPIYAVLRGAERTEGVAFARVQAGKDLEMEGFSEHEDSLPRRVEHGFEDMRQQMESWERVLTNLATGFYYGEARVDPKVYPKTCAGCEARILCRLNREAMEDDETEGEPEAEEFG